MNRCVVLCTSDHSVRTGLRSETEPARSRARRGFWWSTFSSLRRVSRSRTGCGSNLGCTPAHDSRSRPHDLRSRLHTCHISAAHTRLYACNTASEPDRPSVSVRSRRPVAGRLLTKSPRQPARLAASCETESTVKCQGGTTENSYYLRSIPTIRARAELRAERAHAIRHDTVSEGYDSFPLHSPICGCAVDPGMSYMGLHTT